MPAKRATPIFWNFIPISRIFLFGPFCRRAIRCNSSLPYGRCGVSATIPHAGRPKISSTFKNLARQRLTPIISNFLQTPPPLKWLGEVIVNISKQQLASYPYFFFISKNCFIFNHLSHTEKLLCSSVVFSVTINGAACSSLAGS